MVRESVEEAVSRLRRAVESAAPAEPQRPDSDRRLTGEASDRSIRLSLIDSNWTRRRIGWKVEFVGQMARTPEGTVLIGEVDIADHRAFRQVMWLFRGAALLPFLFGIAYVTGYLPADQPPISAGLFGIGVPVVAFLAARWLELSIERAAADDARVLINFLNLELT